MGIFDVRFLELIQHFEETGAGKYGQKPPSSPISNRFPTRNPPKEVVSGSQSTNITMANP